MVEHTHGVLKGPSAVYGNLRARKEIWRPASSQSRQHWARRINGLLQCKAESCFYVLAGSMCAYLANFMINFSIKKHFHDFDPIQSGHSVVWSVWSIDVTLSPSQELVQMTVLMTAACPVATMRCLAQKWLPTGRFMIRISHIVKRQHRRHR